MPNSEPVQVVRKVTREHGNAFADAIYDEATGTTAIYSACMQAGIIAWPKTDEAAQASTTRS